VAERLRGTRHWLDPPFGCCSTSVIARISGAIVSDATDTR
jgi:hypothetical protein